MIRPGRLLVGLTTLALTMAGCGGSAGSAGSATRTAGSEPGVSGTVTVFAAASLTDVFTALGKQFESAHPGVRVQFNFAGSSTLAEQINQGAPADVFAAASTSTMQTVVDADGSAGAPRVFATNTLQIVVPAGNPAGISGLADLADPSRKIALCAEQVPCGAAALAVFAEAKLTPKPDTLEQDVRSVLTKVELGEVDAGLVYRTDVLVGGDKVGGLDFPEAADNANRYPITVLSQAPNPGAAAAFVALVQSPDGLAQLQAAGFGRP
ncbi:MAG: molybdate ABC transporter substrate-binding protein [Geodermatophilaceae bacterium]